MPLWASPGSHLTGTVPLAQTTGLHRGAPTPFGHGRLPVPVESCDAVRSFRLLNRHVATRHTSPTRPALQAVHEVGGYGSAGYGYNWKLAESEKNLLRTHTTAVSSRMLYKLANQPGGFK